MAGKTNYFGTFLDTLNAPARGPSGTPASVPELDTILKIWPTAPKARMSVADVAKVLDVSVTTSVEALTQLERVGLAANNAGVFALTPAGIEAAKLVQKR